MDRRVSEACQINVRSRESFGRPLLGDAVLDRWRIGRVECGAKAVPVGLCESDPAADQPLLPLCFGHVLDLGVGNRKGLELFPVECSGFGLGVGSCGREAGSSACAGRPSPSRSSSSIAATRARTSGIGTSTRLRLPQSVHSNSTQAGFDADVAASSSVRRMSSTFSAAASASRGRTVDGSAARRSLAGDPSLLTAVSLVLTAMIVGCHRPRACLRRGKPCLSASAPCSVSRRS